MNQTCASVTFLLAACAFDLCSSSTNISSSSSSSGFCAEKASHRDASMLDESSHLQVLFETNHAGEGGMRARPRSSNVSPLLSRHFSPHPLEPVDFGLLISQESLVRWVYRLAFLSIFPGMIIVCCSFTYCLGEDPESAGEGHSDWKKFKDLKVSPAGKICSFNRVKAIYIFYLVASHMKLLNSPKRSIHHADHLPYETVDHGIEGMMGLFFISGWLSSATWKDMAWTEHMKKRVARLLPTYFVGAAITLVPIVLTRANAMQILQYVLECLTLGGWNPFLSWHSCNRPLWFVSTLLSWQYICPCFLAWIRKLMGKHLVLLFLGLYTIRLLTGLLTLVCLKHLVDVTRFDNYDRLIHAWTPMQIWVPAMGAILHQLAERLEVAPWVGPRLVRLSSDLLTVLLAVTFVFFPVTNVQSLDAMISYANALTGPLIAGVVMLLSCDSNSILALTGAWPELSKLFDSMLSLSYVLYCTHWAVAFTLHRSSLFVDDSMQALLGMYATVILVSILLQACIVGPLNRMVQAWVSPQSGSTAVAGPGKEKLGTNVLRL